MIRSIIRSFPAASDSSTGEGFLRHLVSLEYDEVRLGSLRGFAYQAKSLSSEPWGVN
jgi:hypothetical protein